MSEQCKARRVGGKIRCVLEAHAADVPHKGQDGRQWWDPKQAGGVQPWAPKPVNVVASAGVPRGTSILAADWICGQCDQLNDAMAASCSRCSLDRPVGSMAAITSLQDAAGTSQPGRKRARRRGGAKVQPKGVDVRPDGVEVHAEPIDRSSGKE